MLGPFGEGEDFVLAGVRTLLSKGLVINGNRHPVEIFDHDSASDPARAAELASTLIKSEKVDLMLAVSTGDTVTPVSNLCEKSGVPCITTNTPWQVYLMGRGNPQASFDWTYHFFWGMEDVIAVFTNMWSALPNNKVVGALWPDEADGYAHSDPETGFPATLDSKGFRLVDPGRFPRSTTDYSTLIQTFKSEKVEILTGVLPSPAFAEFWRQARQLDFHLKVATIAKSPRVPFRPRGARRLRRRPHHRSLVVS